MQSACLTSWSGMQHHQPGLPSNYMHTGRDMPTSPAAVIATLRSAQAKGPGSPLLPTHSNAAASASARVSLSLPSALYGDRALVLLVQKKHAGESLSRREVYCPLTCWACILDAARDSAYSNAPHH